jgi:hypothetical protein
MGGTVGVGLVYAGTIAAFLLAALAGWGFGRTRPRSDADDGAGTEIGGLLALLGLLLAFTFGMAGSRYETRKELLLDEANAIGTAWLRADLLPEPDRTEVRDLFRAYVDARLKAAAGGSIAEGIAASERIHAELWSRAVRNAERAPNPIAALVVQSVNEVIDMHGKRVTLGWRNRVPETILVALYALAILALLLLGFEAGARGVRRPVPTVVLVVTLATVVALIVDLDRPGEGLLRVSQQAMLDLRAGMKP